MCDAKETNELLGVPREQRIEDPIREFRMN